jgi:hypothetical protein
LLLLVFFLPGLENERIWKISLIEVIYFNLWCCYADVAATVVDLLPGFLRQAYIQTTIEKLC